VDVPAGRDQDSGDARGIGVDPTRTFTLALPKPVLTAVDGST
jgi:NAD(P)H-hydrate repair Nnr-like enzyme with NAD(P)H-hydrate epimerase domain